MTGEAALDRFYDALLDDDAQQLYDRAPCGYLSTAPNGTITKVNDTFLTWTGYQRAELVGRRTFAQLLTRGGQIYHETHYRPMLEMQGTAREIALEIVRADGSRLPALVNAVLERDESGAAVVVRAAIFDATERRLYERELLGAKQRAEESERLARELARTLQHTLIPPEPPAIPGLQLGAVYRPAGQGAEVGGDFYDAFQISSDEWVIAIGDVCGKGVEAAIITALVRYTIRGAAMRDSSPACILDVLNGVLLRHDTDRFCTVALARLRPREGGWQATIGAGGHPLPYVHRAGGELTSVGRPGSLIGILDTATFHDTDVVLEPGDLAVLYTDGVTEARRGRGFFGEARLEAAIANHAGSGPGVVEGILADLLAFEETEPPDDVTMVAVLVG